MVRLRLGRFAWELYYTRNKAVLATHEVRRRAGLICGHLGYVTGMMEYVMTDMIWMRVWASIGCTMVATYQLVQPRVQWPSVTWNTIYVGINMFQIYALLQDPPDLQGDEADLGKAVRPYFKVHQVITLLDLGEFRHFEDASRLSVQGRQIPNDEVYILTSGSCEARVDGISVDRLGPGSIIGDVGLQQGDASNVSSVTVLASGEDVRCFCVNRAELNERVAKDAELKDSMQGLLAESALQKVLSSNSSRDVLQYAAVLRFFRSKLDLTGHAGEHPGLPDAIEDFRNRHKISMDEHDRVWAELLRFEAEQKSSETEDWHILDRASPRLRVQAEERCLQTLSM